MHTSDAIPILNCALDRPCYFNIRVSKTIFECRKIKSIHKLRIQACIVFRPLQSMVVSPEISIAGRKCCVRVQKGGFMIESSLTIEFWVSIFYLKLCIHIYTYIYIYTFVGPMPPPQGPRAHRVSPKCARLWCSVHFSYS